MNTEADERITLLVDNSNTRTKFMRARGEELLPGLKMLPTAELTPEKLRLLLQDWSYGRAVVCSVVPAARQAIAEGVEAPVELMGADSSLNIQLDYPEPETLGADRIANAAAAAARCPLPCVAVIWERPQPLMWWCPGSRCPVSSAG